MQLQVGAHISVSLRVDMSDFANCKNIEIDLRVLLFAHALAPVPIAVHMQKRQRNCMFMIGLHSLAHIYT